jgi:hypothetical protein
VLGPTGPVREILPPGDGRDYYYLYIRDVEDGVTTFDQIAPSP